MRSGDLRATVIVVSHNSAADLERCLAVLRPTLGADDEVLVYDNASADESADLAERLGVRVIRSLTNLGFAAGGNRAAAAASGRLLVFLNPDTEVEPGWLEPLLAPIGLGPGLTTAQVVLIDRPDRIDACGNLVHVSGITVCRGHGRAAGAYAEEEAVLAVSGAAFAIDRGSFERLGGFDETFFMYLEDTDLSLRAALAGVPCRYVAASRVRHRHRPSFGPGKLHWLERNRWLMLLKLWSARTLVGLLPTLLLIEALTWTYAALLGRAGLRAKVSAWLWLWRHPWQVAAARRRVQRTRRVPDADLLARCTWRLDLTELVASPVRRRLAEALALAPLALAGVFLRVVAGQPRAARSR